MDMGIGAAGAGQAAKIPGGAEPAAPAAPAKADASDVERFRSALASEGNAAQPPPTENVQAGSETPAAKAAGQSMGERILDGMNSLGDKIQAGRAEAASVIAKPEATHSDLLRANMALMETGTIVTAASKTTEKITQGIKTLQQG